MFAFQFFSKHLQRYAYGYKEILNPMGSITLSPQFATASPSLSFFHAEHVILSSPFRWLLGFPLCGNAFY